MFRKINLNKFLTHIILIVLVTIISYIFVGIRSEGGFESKLLNYVAILFVGVFYIVAFPAFYIVYALNFISLPSCIIALLVDCIIWGFLIERLSAKWKTIRSK